MGLWVALAVLLAVTGLAAVAVGIVRHHAGSGNWWLAAGAMVAVAGSISAVSLGHSLNPPPCANTFEVDSGIASTGPPTPKAALHIFLVSRSQPRLPARGWHLVSRSDGAAEFASGRSRVWLTHAEGWLVSGGNVCGGKGTS